MLAEVVPELRTPSRTRGADLPPSTSLPPFSLIRVVMRSKSPSVFPGVVGTLTSVQSVEQQQDGAEADHRAQDERIPSFPQVDSLDEVVDGGEPVSEGPVSGNVNSEVNST